MDSKQKRQLLIYSWVFLFDAAFLGVSAVADLVPKHAFDMAWSDHARFHVTLAASHMFALSIVMALLAWFPFREGRRWSWFALLATTVFGLGTIPLIARWQGSGPPTGIYITILAALVISLIALALSWKLMGERRRGIDQNK